MTITDQNIPSDPDQLQQLAGQLHADYADLEARYSSLEARHKAEIMNRDMMIEKLRHQLFGFRKDKYGTSSESLDQLGLRLEDEETDLAAKTAAAEDAASTDGLADDNTADRQKPVRRALPQHLPRNDIELMPEAPCRGCGNALSIADNIKTLGEDVLEELEYIPGRYVVNRIVRPRMACKACETISQAD